MPAAGFQLLGQPPRHVRIHGRGGDEHGILGQGFGNAVLAEQNGFGLRGVDDHADDNVGRLCGLRRCLGAAPAVSDKPGDGVSRDIAAGHAKTRARERGRHAKTHRTQPNDGDARFLRCCFRHKALPPVSSPNLTAALPFGYHGLAALPKHETRRQRGCCQDTVMTETGVRDEICRLGRSLFERGLTPGSSGNISVQTDDGGWLVTPTNASLGALDPARLSRLGPDGRLVSGDAPTKEVPLHTALYQTRHTARAVVHLHSTHSVALSMLPEIDPRAALPPMTAYYLMKCGLTALVPYYRPGDPAVADAIKGLAGKYASVLLAHHGPVVAGESLEAAVFAMEELEETAKLYLLLRGLNPRFLSPEQVADLTKVFGLTLPEPHEHH